ncbi:trans-aconitate methyltransferase [Amycolatopsis lexingtonensis]|uniref:Trans-aconitate methyltransferase n=1 Tax=Amycolatopsis lexingtonensis TaxID=218822 RepID=A0ABR9HTY6_9PSEU|nr:SAM-dependent methyltransferase [Amycolatopsis lexingtonensis]MBE1494384.1 trans-aconitate methyltransferase [Amycolatopsis lexingtonensis]
MTGELSWVPPEIDTSVPNPARVYDFWLDGDHNFAADRALGEQILKIMPGVRDAARLNRAFLRRAARYLVGQGVRQFLDIGSGIPTVGNLHEIVQQADPSCRVVYVDRESVAVAHSELLLQDNDNTLVLQADLRDVNDIFDGAGKLLDLDEPVAVFMLLLLHFVPDSWDPVGILARYRDRLAPGSFLAVTHVAADSDSQRLDEAVEVYKSNQDQQNQPVPRTHDEVLAFFDGFELVDPGVVGCAMWKPEGAGDMSDDPAINALPYAGVGRKP